MLDVGNYHKEPVHHAIERVAARFKAARLAMSSEEYKDFPGYMGSTETKLPHVLDNGNAWFANVFLARLFFLAANHDLTDETMGAVSKLEQDSFRGVLCFRFARVEG